MGKTSKAASYDIIEWKPCKNLSFVLQHLGMRSPLLIMIGSDLRLARQLPETRVNLAVYITNIE